MIKDLFLESVHTQYRFCSVMLLNKYFMKNKVCRVFISFYKKKKQLMNEIYLYNK